MCIHNIYLWDIWNSLQLSWRYSTKKKTTTSQRRHSSWSLFLILSFAVFGPGSLPKLYDIELLLTAFPRLCCLMHLVKLTGFQTCLKFSQSYELSPTTTQICAALPISKTINMRRALRLCASTFSHQVKLLLHHSHQRELSDKYCILVSDTSVWRLRRYWVRYVYWYHMVYSRYCFYAIIYALDILYRAIDLSAGLGWF